MTIVRPATSFDARRLAEIHVDSWRVAYRSILPEAALNELSIESRLPWWEHVLGAGIDGFHVLVVEDADGAVAGFGSACPSDADPLQMGEVPQLYLRPDAWGTGLAAPLLSELEANLRGRGFGVAVLHVAPQNTRACRFYQRHGWRATGAEHRETVWGVEFVTTTYRRDL